MDYYLNTLREIYESGVNDIKDSQTASEKFKAFNREVNNYLNFIPEFFSETGDAKSIKNMYSLMSEKRNSEKMMDYVDINQSSYVYTEYVDGMKKFISEIIESDTITESTTVIDNLDNAITNDSLFIESIFGGSNNGVIKETVMNASKNLEFLIDFIPTLESYVEDANGFVNRISTLSKDDDTTVLKTLSMYMESVSHYSHQVIGNVIRTYSDIQSILNSQPIKNKTTKTFVLY